MAAPPAALGSARAIQSANSPGLADLLEQNRISLLVSTYQAGMLMAVRGSQGKITTLLRQFDTPMGIALLETYQLALGTRGQVWLFGNAPDLAPQMAPVGKHDACFVPRMSYVTGNIRGHEMAWASDELWLVNTHFSCLCSLHPEYSFFPRWRPSFITALSPEDRCHLNGLAVADGQPKYVTALGETNTPEGWRPGKAQGGIIIDVASGEIVCRGLSMPHSPRVHDGRLFVLDSGTGRLQVVDVATGKRDTVAEVPGYARGLSFYGPYAFVAVSKIRETSRFGDLPISARLQDLQCGIWVVSVTTGQTVQFMQFRSGVEEIFAVEVLVGSKFPEILGFQQETLYETFLMPPAAEQGHG
jgi:uncharacterized protein (TIGR03032 family)